MLIFAVIIDILLIAIDQLTKLVAVNYLKPISRADAINGIFEFAFVENRGAAFGIMSGGRWFFVILTIVIILLIGYYYVTLPKTKEYKLVRFALILISSGAIGNFIDRFRQGYVVDFIHTTFIEFPVFNVADMYVVVGTIFLAIIMFFVIK